MQRRQFLRTLGSSASFTALAQGMALAAWQRPVQAALAHPRWRADPFALGVASGEPEPDSVLLWTRLYPGMPVPGQSATDAEQAANFEEKSGSSAFNASVVSYEIYSDEALRQRVQQGEVRTDRERGWSVHARVSGLQPGRPYWYRFRSGDAVSPVGRTRTSPAPDADIRQLRLALASCQHYEQGHYAAHADMARRDLDLVLFVGDYIYEGSNPKYLIRPHTGKAPKTLPEYRERHALYKQDADLRACHAAHPWVCTWDDHEVVNDYANDQDPAYTDPQQFLLRRAAAYQAYFEHMPVWPGGPGGAHPRIHRHRTWGRLADLWTLDCRQYRTPQPCRDPLKGGGRVVVNCETAADAHQSMLGAAQEAWIRDGLAQSRRTWRLLAQSTQISSTGIDTPVGRSIYTDGWDGYAAARARLLSAVAETGPRNVLTLGGDVHQHVAANLRVRPNDDSSPVVAAEFVTTSITSRGMSPGALERIRASNPDIAHARSDERGYVRVDVTPNAITGAFLSTPFPAQPGATLGVQATYRVRHGQAGVEAV
ncbi:MAG TPA: alkaline phosphatase D family protein [Burkholderiaceae bacterium]|nr:alkaline phosphatase D family protein [Burkholderiaceae bacterium]